MCVGIYIHISLYFLKNVKLTGKLQVHNFVFLQCLSVVCQHDAHHPQILEDVFEKARIFPCITVTRHPNQKGASMYCYIPSLRLIQGSLAVHIVSFTEKRT